MTDDTDPAQLDFRALFEAISAPCLVVTPGLRIVAVSDGYLRATGLAREALLGRPVAEAIVDGAAPVAGGALVASFERVRRDRSSDALPSVVVRGPDIGGVPDERVWSPLAFALGSDPGEPRYLVHRLDDLTEVVRLRQQQQLAAELHYRAQRLDLESHARADEARAARRQLDEANAELARLYDKTRDLERLKSHFFGNLNRALCAPLVDILAATDGMLASGLDPAQRERAEQIAREARLLQHQLGDVLDASRLRAGRMEVQLGEVDLAELVRQIGRPFGPHAQSRAIDFTVDVPDALPARVDPDLLQRIVLHLLSNAFKYTPDHGQIRCTLRRQGTARAVLKIADSGPGIPTAQRAQIFEPFRQGDDEPARRIGGTGLGLSIARDFAELHGGTIAVSEGPEGGALFTVDLPVALAGVTAAAPAFAVAAGDAARPIVEALASPLPAPAAAPSSPLLSAPATLPATASVAVAGTRAVVLVVSDDEAQAAALREALLGACTVISGGAAGAIGAALDARPAVILCDDATSAVVLDGARAHAALAATPVLVVTDHAEPTDALASELLRRGATDLLTRPLAPAVLRARVAGLVRGHQTAERTRQLGAELAATRGTLEATAARLAHAQQDLEAFSYSVAHDLRAPLRSIDGFSQALVEDVGDRLDADSRGHLARVRTSAQHMGSLIDDLLHLTRLGRTELTRRRIDLAALARRVTARLQGATGRHVEIAIADELTADADPQLLSIVLEQLVDNAWKFTSGRDPGRIEVFATDDPDGRVFHVRDNGVGFDMAYAGKLFGVFQRLHAAGEFPGNGIGLATVERIVRRHGGRVWAEGQVGRGATFHFTLPS